MELDNESVIEVSVLGDGGEEDFTKCSFQKLREINNSFSHLTSKWTGYTKGKFLLQKSSFFFIILKAD